MDRIDTRISEFVDRLSCAETGETVTNQYADNSASNAIRRANLRLYLTEMADNIPRTLLVGEAPGYLGCRLTGVPFTSEEILLRGTTDARMFGSWRGYQATGVRPKPAAERTATFVWRALSKCAEIPLLWNAFPFHPHRADEEWSNRPPTAGELAQGSLFLMGLAEIFPVERFVAVGNTAWLTLRHLSLDSQRVRHPSHGGARQFAAEMQRLLNPGPG